MAYEASEIGAGTLTERITFQRQQTISDGGGGHSIQWVDMGKRWARVRAMSGNERAAAAQRQTSADYVVFIRNDGLDVQMDDRIVWSYLPGKQMNITFIGYAGTRPLYLRIEATLGELS